MIRCRGAKQDKAQASAALEADCQEIQGCGARRAPET